MLAPTRRLVCATFLFALPTLVTTMTAQVDKLVADGTGELLVDVRYKDSVPVGREKDVQLMTGVGVTVATAQTNAAGQAIFRGLTAGQYQLRVRGPGVDDTDSIESVAIPSPPGHVEQTLYVRRTSGVPESSPGRVAAVDLVIPDKARIELLKAVADIEQNRLDPAQKRLERLIAAQPNYADAYTAIGVLYGKRGNLELGKQAFQNAIRLDDRNSAAHLNMGKVLVHERRFADAEQAVHAALVTDPRNPETWTVLALTQLHQQKFADAIASAQRTHALPHTGFATSHLIAAGAYETLGDFPKAAAELRTYLAENPSSPASGKIEARLKDLASRR